ncbi:MAG: hypothetical protein ACK5Y2_02700 [Bdellovibrionales bacterium]
MGPSKFIKTTATVMAFWAIMTVPQLIQAQSELSISDCLKQIQSHWATKVVGQLEGNTRHNTSCQLDVQISQASLDVMAVGNPLQIQFSLLATPKKDEKSEQTLVTCKVDKEKLHLVFEEKQEGAFEKREHVQMTLLKRHGQGLSLILAKREMKLFRLSQHSNLICHLN